MMCLFFVLPSCIPTFVTELETPLCTDANSQWSKSFRFWPSQSQGAKWLGSLRLFMSRALERNLRFEKVLATARDTEHCFGPAAQAKSHRPRHWEVETLLFWPTRRHSSAAEPFTKIGREECMGVPVFWRLSGVMRLLVSCTRLECRVRNRSSLQCCCGESFILHVGITGRYLSLLENWTEGLLLMPIASKKTSC